MKMPKYPFPTSRNNQIRQGAGLERVEESLTEIVDYIYDQQDDINSKLEAAQAAAEQAAEYAEEAFSGTPEGYDTLVGDVGDLKAAFYDSLVLKPYGASFDQGGISASSGSNTSANNRIRTHNVLPSDIIGFKTPTNMSAYLYAFVGGTYQGRYTNLGTFSKSTATGTETVSFKECIFKTLSGYDSTYSYKFVLYKDDNSNLTPSAGADVDYYYYTDSALSLSTKAADAKATGDVIDGIYKSIDSILYNDNALVSFPSAVTAIVNSSMTIADFRTAFNAKLSDYAALCKIDGSTSFNSLTTNENTWEKVYAAVNKVFRSPVYFDGITHEMFCKRVNYAFTTPIRQFMDAKLNDGTARDFSIKFSARSGEPSAIVSPDGASLYVYSIIGGKRYATSDGIKWDSGTSLTFDSTFTPEHGNVNLIDGVYYLIGPDNNNGDAGRDLRLWTSTDGLAFTYKGILIAKDHDFGNNEPIKLWGNSYLIKDNGTFYLFIEAKGETLFWQIYLTKCTNILHNEGDTIGNWIDNSTNPVLGGDPFPASANVDACGNPDFYKGEDNRPIRVNGKWLMLFHVTHNGASFIFRAVSSNLTEWTIENNLINNRDAPTAGESSAGNADQAIIGFKGRTYLFYTWDINSANTPYIKYLVDDRPIHEMMHVMA